MNNIVKRNGNRNPNELIGAGLVVGGSLWALTFFSFWLILPILMVGIGTTMIDFKR